MKNLSICLLVIILLDIMLSQSKYTNFKLGYQNEVNHFIDYLTGRAEILESPIEDSIIVSRLIDCIYQSIEVNKEIEFS